MGGILIADAGSTNTSWAFIPDKSSEIVRWKTAGLNPVQTSEDNILSNFEIIRQDFPKQEIVKEIYFYGAGCTTPLQIDTIKLLLSRKWPEIRIFVDSDMIGAAKALFGDGKGIACILGTGSNSCLYQNGKIIEKIPSLGFILGDEGSGAALGKRLINGIFKKSFPEEINAKFRQRFDLNIETLIENVYKKPMAAGYLASFSPFILDNINESSLQQLVFDEIDSFFLKNINHYKDTEAPLGFIGSIAFHFKDILQGVAEKYGKKITKIIRDPLDNLVGYHKSLL